MSKEVINFNPTGTCCKVMQITVEDGIVVDSQFMGGCSGNLQAMSRLVEGKDIDEVISLLKGIKCRSNTSCGDQLSKALEKYKFDKLNPDVDKK